MANWKQNVNHKDCYFEKTFEVYTETSSTQLGSVITQSNRPLDFFSCKLSDSQQRYSSDGSSDVFKNTMHIMLIQHHSNQEQRIVADHEHLIFQAEQDELEHKERAYQQQLEWEERANQACQDCIQQQQFMNMMMMQMMGGRKKRAREESEIDSDNDEKSPSKKWICGKC